MEYLEGVFQIANVVLSLSAGYIALTMLKTSKDKPLMKPWRYLVIVLVIFCSILIFGALRSFDIYSSPYLTHVLTTVALGVLIVAILSQIKVVELS